MIINNYNKKQEGFKFFPGNTKKADMKRKQYKTGMRCSFFSVLLCLLSCGPIPIPEQPIEPVIPPWSKETKIEGREAAGFYGISVYIFNDTIIFGSEEDIGGLKPVRSGAGSAYIYTLDQAVWIKQQKLIASDYATMDCFGQSVSISGNNVIVGAPSVDSGDGAVYFFTWNGKFWTDQQKYMLGAVGAEFGFHVDISGNYAIVGAPYLGNGKAYIYHKKGTSWRKQQELSIIGTVKFGYSVSISGEHAIVGDPYYVNNEILTGIVYAYAWNGTIWKKLGSIIPKDAKQNDQFGASVYISGNHAIIGAPNTLYDDNSRYGAAYIFHRSGYVWTEIQKLTAGNDREAGAGFGTAVSLYRDYAVVGSPMEGISGAVHIFHFVEDESKWMKEPKLTGTTDTEDAEFGYSVNISKNYIVVGAPFDNNNETGSVFIYE